MPYIGSTYVSDEDYAAWQQQGLVTEEAPPPPPPAPVEQTPAQALADPAPEPAPAPIQANSALGYDTAPAPAEEAPAPAPAEQTPAQALADPVTTPAPEPTRSDGALGGILPDSWNDRANALGSAVREVGDALEPYTPQVVQDAAGAVDAGVQRLQSGLTRTPAPAGLAGAGDPAIDAQIRDAERRGSTVVGDLRGPGELVADGLEEAGEFKDRLVSDPGGTISTTGNAIRDTVVGAAGAIRQDPGVVLDVAGNALNEAANYAPAYARQKQADALYEHLTTGKPLEGWDKENMGTAVADVILGPVRWATGIPDDTDARIVEQVLTDPDVRRLFIEAYEGGYTQTGISLDDGRLGEAIRTGDPSGLFVEGSYMTPGGRAAQQAWQDTLSTGDAFLNDLASDPTIIPSAILGLAKGSITGIPGIGRGLARGLGAADDLVQSAQVLGLNKVGGAALNAARRGAQRSPLGQLSPNQQIEDLADEGSEAAQQLLTDMRAGGRVNTPPATVPGAAAPNVPAAAVQVAAPGGLPVQGNRSIPWHQQGTAPTTSYPSADAVPVGQVVGSTRPRFYVGADARFDLRMATDGTTWVVKENIPAEPEWTFVRRNPARPQARTLPANTFLSDDPETDALRFAQRKYFEWQNAAPGTTWRLAPQFEGLSPLAVRTLENTARQRMDDLGLGDVGLRIVRQLTEIDPAAPANAVGSFNRGRWLVGLASGGSLDEAVSSVNHEAVHALRTAGALREAEWRALSRLAATKQAADGRTYLDNARDLYATLDNLSDEGMVEEAVAEMFREYVANPRLFTGETRTILEKLKQVLTRIREVFGGTPDGVEVLRRIDAGDVGARRGANPMAPVDPPDIENMWRLARRQGDGDITKDPTILRTLDDLDEVFPEAERIAYGTTKGDYRKPPRGWSSFNDYVDSRRAPDGKAAPIGGSPLRTAGMPISQIQQLVEGDAWLKAIDDTVRAHATKFGVDAKQARSTVQALIDRTGIRPYSTRDFLAAHMLDEDARFWYALGAEAMNNRTDFSDVLDLARQDPQIADVLRRINVQTPEEMKVLFFRMVAATSGGQTPWDNTLSAAGIIGEMLRGEPLYATRRDVKPVYDAFNGDPGTLKFANFFVTLMHYGELTDKVPAPVIDLQMAHLHGLKDNGPLSNNLLFEMTGRYAVELASANNRALDVIDPQRTQIRYTPDQMQAILWVYVRELANQGKGNNTPVLSNVVREAKADHYGQVQAQLGGALGLDGPLTTRDLIDESNLRVFSPTAERFKKGVVAEIPVTSTMSRAAQDISAVRSDLEKIVADRRQEAQSASTAKAAKQAETEARNAEATIRWMDDQRQAVDQKILDSLAFSWEDPVTGQKYKNLLSSLVTVVRGKTTPLSRLDITSVSVVNGVSRPTLTVTLAEGAKSVWDNLPDQTIREVMSRVSVAFDSPVKVGTLGAAEPGTIPDALGLRFNQTGMTAREIDRWAKVIAGATGHDVAGRNFGSFTRFVITPGQGRSLDEAADIAKAVAELDRAGLDIDIGVVPMRYNMRTITPDDARLYLRSLEDASPDRAGLGVGAAGDGARPGAGRTSDSGAGRGRPVLDTLDTLAAARELDYELIARTGRDAIATGKKPANNALGSIESRRQALAQRLAERDGDTQYRLRPNARRYPNTRANQRAGRAGQVMQFPRRTPAAGVPRSSLTARRGPTNPVSPPRPATVGIYSDPFEQAAGVHLPEDVKRGLATVIQVKGVPRSIGDVAMDYQQQIDRMRALSVTPNAVWNAADGAMARRLKEAFNDLDVDFATMTDEQADKLAARLVGRDVKISEGALSPTGKPIPAKGPTGKAVAALDSYMTLRRNMTLYSTFTGPSYIMMQGVGNALSTALYRPTALNDYFKFWEWGKIRRYADDPFATAALPSVILARQKYGLTGGGTLLDTFHSSMGSGTWFSQPGRGPIAKAVGKAVAPEWIKRFANGMDTVHRFALYWDAFDPAVTEARKMLPAHARATLARMGRDGGGPIPVSPRAVERAIRDLSKREKGQFDGKQLRDAIFAAGGGQQSPSSQALWRFADRMGRDWTETVRKIDKAAQGVVDEGAFPFKETNLDAVLNKAFMFHYWMSRASVLYLDTAMKNPAQMKAWMGAMRAAEERKEEEGLPAWRRTFIDLMGTPAGYVLSFNPAALLSTYFFFAETGGDTSVRQLTGLGRFFDEGYGDNFMMNPLLEAALYTLGLMGKDASVPDVIGSRKIEREISNGIQLANGLMDGWFKSQEIGNERYPMVTDVIDSRYLLNRAAEYLSGIVPGSEKVAPFNPDGGNRDQMIYLIAEGIKRRNPTMAARLGSRDEAVAAEAAAQLETAVHEALNDPSSEVYQEARESLSVAPSLGPWAEQGGLPAVAGMLVRRISPFGFVQAPEGKVEAQKRARLDQKTAEDAAINGLRFAGSEENWQLGAAMDRYFGGDVWVEALLRIEDPTLSGQQLFEAGAKARAERNNPVARRARELAAIDDRYYEIVGGKTSQTLTLSTGESIDPGTLAGLTAEQRYDWADAWLADQGVEREFGAWRAAKEELLTANPDLAGYEGFKDIAAAYPGGVDLWITDTMKVNPGYREFVEGLQRSGDAMWGTPEFHDLALKTRGFKAAEGIRSSPWETGPKGNGKYAGLPENQSLASWYFETNDKGGASYDDKDLSSLEKDLAYMDEAIRIADQWGVTDTLVNQVITGDRTTYKLPYDAYKAITAATRIPSGEYSDIAAYLAWTQQNPGREDLSPEAFLREGGAAGVSKDRDEALPTEAAQGAANPGGLTVSRITGRDMSNRQDEKPLTVNRTVVNLRSDPGMESEVLTILRFGEPVKAVGEKVTVDGQTWVMLQTADGQWMGWMNTAYLSLAA